MKIKKGDAENCEETGRRRDIFIKGREKVAKKNMVAKSQWKGRGTQKPRKSQLAATLHLS